MADGGCGGTRACERVLDLEPDEAVVDLFAGGGGASEGFFLALGRHPDLAINHDPEAIALHRANHPTTRHLCEDIHAVNPRVAMGGRRVGLLWASPDCTFHSKARGGKPFRDPKRAEGRRGMANVVVKWADEVRPRVIFLENVEEFQDWGPLDASGRPDKSRKGQLFKRWVGELRALGYVVEWRELRASDFGAPTIRKRLFLIARCDGKPIVWPAPTHGPGLRPVRTAAECIDWSLDCPSIFGRKKPLATKTLARIGRGIQRFVIDAARPFIVPTTHGGSRDGSRQPDLRCHSIDESVRTVTGAHRGDLALVTPFVSRFNGTGDGQPADQSLATITTKDRFGLVAATLVHSGNGEREGQAPRVYDITKPLSTVMAEGVKHGLVTAFVSKQYGGHEATGSSAAEAVHTVTAQGQLALVASSMVKLYGSCADGQDLRQPAPTVRARGTHLAETRAFLTLYYGENEQGRARAGQSLELPFNTLPTARRFGLVTIGGELYEIADIGFRMLQPRELYRAQGFRDDYLIDIELDDETLDRLALLRSRRLNPSGKKRKISRRRRRTLSKEAQIRMCGNSVCPPMAMALILANVANDVERVAA